MANNTNCGVTNIIRAKRAAIVKMFRSAGRLAPAASFTKLLEPLQVAHVTMRNRSIFGSIHSGMEDKEKDFPELAAYMAER